MPSERRAAVRVLHAVALYLFLGLAIVASLVGVALPVKIVPPPLRPHTAQVRRYERAV